MPFSVARPSRSTLVAFALAGVAHASLITAVAVTPRREPPNIAEAEIDVATLDDLPAPSAVPSETPEQAAATRPEHAAKVAPAHAKEVAGASTTSAEANTNAARGPSEPSESSPSAEAKGEPWSFRPTVAVDVTSRHLVDPRESARAVRREAVVRDPNAPSKTGGLVEALDEADHAKGMWRGGPVLAAVESVARTNDGPATGIATYDVAVDAAGAVSVLVSEATSEMGGWQKLIPAMRAAIAAKHVRIPPGARGLRVVVKIEAKITFIDGRDPRTTGTRVTGTTSSIKETKEAIKIEMPSVTVATSGKVCGAALHVGLDGIGIGGGCSPENAGTGTKRLVFGKIVSESRLGF